MCIPFVCISTPKLRGPLCTHLTPHVAHTPLSSPRPQHAHPPSPLRALCYPARPSHFAVFFSASPSNTCSGLLSSFFSASLLASAGWLSLYNPNQHISTHSPPFAHPLQHREKGGEKGPVGARREGKTYLRHALLVGIARGRLLLLGARLAFRVRGLAACVCWGGHDCFACVGRGCRV